MFTLYINQYGTINTRNFSAQVWLYYALTAFVGAITELQVKVPSPTMHKNELHSS